MQTPINQLGSFALSEPSSGSDAFALKTTATKSKDGSYYTISGSKMWITNSAEAEIFLVGPIAHRSRGRADAATRRSSPTLTRARGTRESRASLSRRRWASRLPRRRRRSGFYWRRLASRGWEADRERSLCLASLVSRRHRPAPSTLTTSRCRLRMSSARSERDTSALVSLAVLSCD